MSIKKFKKTTDFTKLSAWGGEKQPFIALIDFNGNLSAWPLDTETLTAAADTLSGRIADAAGALHFRFNIAPQEEPEVLTQSTLGPGGSKTAQASLSALQITATPDKSSVTHSIRLLQAELTNGMSYLVNYCSQTTVTINSTLDSLFEHSRAPFTIWFDAEFIAFSPEAFISVAGDTIVTTPMKGTGYDAQALVADAKEQAEHATVVDLLRNDLGRVASQVRVGAYRFVTKIPQADGRILCQTSTQISGKMPANWRSEIGEWLPRLLPAGSVTGAPKIKTVELIKRFESEPRGFFTGVAVLFDGDNLYSCVLIRYLDLKGPQLKFRSGAGITIYSDPESEYDEIISKVYIPL